MSKLVIGCGCPLRGDDAVGPEVVRRLVGRGLPEGVHLIDGGTAGIDVTFEMRGADEVILVDACSSGHVPGTIFEVAGREVEHEPTRAGISVHALRWDHAIRLGRLLLGDDYPGRVTAFLVEGACFDVGAELSHAVDRAIERLVAVVLDRVGGRPAADAPHVRVDLR